MSETIETSTPPPGRTPGFAFRVTATSGAARTGVLTTPHGDVPTPIFMPFSNSSAST